VLEPEQFGYILRRQGFAEQEALNFVACVLAQECTLFDRLDPFGNDVNPSALPMAMIAWAMALSSEPCGRSRTKDRSILMVSIGNCFIMDIDE
jgi:hypothetical protein